MEIILKYCNINNIIYTFYVSLPILVLERTLSIFLEKKRNIFFSNLRFITNNDIPHLFLGLPKSTSILPFYLIHINLYFLNLEIPLEY